MKLKDSMCHPAFIPKHTTLKKIVGTLLCVITLGIPHAIAKAIGKPSPWPVYGNKEEKCIYCGCAPGLSQGCWKVATGGRTKEGIEFPQVKHSNEVEKLITEPA